MGGGGGLTQGEVVLRRGPWTKKMTDAHDVHAYLDAKVYAQLPWCKACAGEISVERSVTYRTHVEELSRA